MALKDLKQGATVKLSKLENEEHRTTPPGRFSETRLVAELEAKDIGRPATYSSIVSLIQDRGYVARKGTQLYPTPLGFAVARMLAAKFPDFTAYEYTAKMEEELDSIATHQQSRPQFLGSFWSGKGGFEALLEKLSSSIDFSEVEKYSTIDLHNGFNIRFSRFGTFLQDAQAEPNEKGFLPSVRLDDSVDVWDYREADFCREVFTNAANKVDARELGVLSSGEYEGWTVWARDGKFGPYLQGLHPKAAAATAEGKKAPASTPDPINHPIPEGLELETVKLSEIEELFAQVKLPRKLSDRFFVGEGKRGPYLGWKSTPKARRAVFVSLPEGTDPRTVTLDEVEAVWQAKEDAKKEKEVKAAEKAAKPKAAPKTAVKPRARAATKAPARKPATKTTTPRKPKASS